MCRVAVYHDQFLPCAHTWLNKRAKTSDCGNPRCTQSAAHPFGDTAVEHLCSVAQCYDSTTELANIVDVVFHYPVLCPECVRARGGGEVAHLPFTAVDVLNVPQIVQPEHP